MAMMPHDLPTVIGRDMAGVVVAVAPIGLTSHLATRSLGS